MKNAISEQLSRGSGHILIGTYLASYAILQYSGLFGPAPGALMHVLHQRPALTGIAAFILHGLAWGAVRWSGSGRSERSRKPVSWPGLAYLGLLLIAAGILLSSMTRFEGRLALSEGQESPLSPEGFETTTLYTRKFARAPGGSLLAMTVDAFPPGRAAAGAARRASVLHRRAGGGEPRLLRLRPLLPAWAAGYRFTARSAGYAPHVSLFTRQGVKIDEFYAVLQLVPAGTEDSFRFDGTIPHTFFMRYYPDASLAPADAGAARPAAGPVFRLRVARNLDVVANQYAAPGEMIYFDRLVLSVDDVRTWVEVQVIHDPGMYLVWPGVVLALCAAVAAYWNRSGRSRRT